MGISVEDVEYIAKLAKLELSSAQKQDMVTQLSRILAYITTLNEVDTAAIPPTCHIVKNEGTLREDRVVRGLSQEEALANAPAQNNGYFSVPKVLKVPK